MKKPYSIRPTDVTSPVSDREVALITATLASPVTHALLASFGVELPAVVQVMHHTGTDDPPDISALGLGWECTEFPPDQSAIDAVHRKQEVMIVPGYSQTDGDIGRIRQLAAPSTELPQSFAVNDEVAALSRVFLEKVIGGPKSKDVPGNDVLLLDQRRCDWPQTAEIALRGALVEKRPTHIRAVLLVRWEDTIVNYSEPPVPVVVQLHPS